MSEENRRIFFTILVLVAMVVAVVWYLTEPPQPSPPAVTVTVAEQKKIEKSAEKTAPTPSPLHDIGIKEPPPITHLRIPAISPTSDVTHVDPRIAASVLTSSDGFDRLVQAAGSAIDYIFTH